MGLVTSLVLEYMEKRAYHLSKAQYCIPDRKVESIAISELVETVAGSETGAILASALLLPSTSTESKALYTASDTTAWFKRTIGFYNMWKFPIDAVLFSALLWAVVVGALGYKITDRMFES